MALSPQLARAKTRNILSNTYLEQELLEKGLNNIIIHNHSIEKNISYKYVQETEYYIISYTMEATIKLMINQGPGILGSISDSFSSCNSAICYRNFERDL